DGSRMRYDGNSDGTGVLFLADGSRYFLNGGTTQYVDRNGNTLNYVASSRQWSDTMGRTISIPWPANPQATDYTYSLLVFATSSTSPKPPTIFTSGTSSTDEPADPRAFTYVVGRGQAGAELFNPVVLAEIILPNGQSYKFSYNEFGEIDKVSYPTGGYQRYIY